MSENKTQGLSIGQLGEINATLNTRVTELENKLHALLAEKRSLYVSLFNHGYGSGHHHTVEGCYTDIHRSDITTYHDDVVGELVEDLLRDMPATTQALNEIKAQGVEEQVSRLEGEYGELDDVCVMVFRDLREFAASLRNNS
ncbi:hypothetical protein [Yersinia proxima]|uniref:hypothetical protein n=1 Tax=Yersinia proxima TaxID=2890316 RepID=UPI001D0F8312|nr:hypothetical protein [Yersinia proxima]